MRSQPFVFRGAVARLTAQGRWRSWAVSAYPLADTDETWTLEIRSGRRGKDDGREGHRVWVA